MVLALCCVLFGGWRLWEEFQALRTEWEADVNGRVIGYPGVQPHFSHAMPPSNWLHDEEESTLLWAGWDREARQHTWFRVGKGEVQPEHLSAPMGIDVVRAIDKPRLDGYGGSIWSAIPPANQVACCEFLGVPLAYPLGVLDKVLIVNDELQKKPILVVYTPFVADAQSVELFNPSSEGERLTMGHSGYLWDGRPLLYDRQTRSLWVPSNEGLKAVAGVRRGAILKRLAHLQVVAWGDWSKDHPDGRLLAGAIRPVPRRPSP